jgi:SAM-dependent methyltransferase
MSRPPYHISTPAPVRLRTDTANAARMYNYWLGGKDNFAADRDAAEAIMRLMPEVVDSIRASRAFMQRAVRFLALSGIRQFLDIGTGFPSIYNVHEIAQSVIPDARVVYVDNDPVVINHIVAFLVKNNQTHAVGADFRDAETVIGQASDVLDFSKPLAVLFLGSLHLIVDDDDPAGLVGQYLKALPAGSYLALSHATDDISPESMHANAAEADRRGATFVPRSRSAIARMFHDRELIDPGLVLVPYLRPDDGDPGPAASKAWVYGGVALV